MNNDLKKDGNQLATKQKSDLMITKYQSKVGIQRAYCIYIYNANSKIQSIQWIRGEVAKADLNQTIFYPLFYVRFSQS